MLAALLLAAACRTAGPPAVPPPPPGAVAAALDPALADAVATWRGADDIEPLARYLERHGDDDSLGVWREVVALHRYDLARQREAPAQPLREIAVSYPDTVAGQVATATLLDDVLASLYGEVPGPKVIDFLEGGRAWAADADGGALPGLDAEALRRAHGEALRALLAAALLDDGCDSTMGYCTWWLTRLASDPRSPDIAAAAKQTWYRRGHPTWQGGEHARCALRCAKRCRERATPLDDRCYGGCYAKC
ncbi:MAG: hypothetical protein U0168_27120 [Nannocystaceae bacterium]